MSITGTWTDQFDNLAAMLDAHKRWGRENPNLRYAAHLCRLRLGVDDDYQQLSRSNVRVSVGQFARGMK